MKKFTLTISVDEDALKQAYLSQNNTLTDNDLPSTSELISQEFGWLEASGISLLNLLKIYQPLTIALGTNTTISWGSEDITEVARERFNSTISDEDAQSVLEFLVNQHDANIGINWDFIYYSMEYLLEHNSISLNQISDSN